MDLNSVTFWRALARFAAAEDGASASEFAILLMILGGCVATALHALGAGDSRFVLALTDLLRPAAG